MGVDRACEESSKLNCRRSYRNQAETALNGNARAAGYPLSMTPNLLQAVEIFSDPRVKEAAGSSPPAGHVISENPATGQPIAAVRLQSKAEYESVVKKAMAA